jgi:hypothetical protein
MFDQTNALSAFTIRVYLQRGTWHVYVSFVDKSPRSNPHLYL